MISRNPGTNFSHPFGKRGGGGGVKFCQSQAAAPLFFSSNTLHAAGEGVENGEAIDDIEMAIRDVGEVDGGER